MTDIQTFTLAEFLLARIAEDERLAGEKHDRFECDLKALDFFGECSCSYPARVLAECEAKRHIVEEFLRVSNPVELDAHNDAERAIGERDLAVTQHILGTVCHYLARPYSVHPDYREEWRP